jgi:hypothetical protein
MPAGKYGQTFTAGDTSVCGFQFKIGTDGGIHGEISVDSDAVLYDVSGTEPVELARKTFPAPIRGVTDFFFDYSIPVQVGKKYFIGIDTGDSAWGLYQICNCQCSCYDGGGRGGFLPDGSFYGGVNNSDDYYFKVYTTTTGKPEISLNRTSITFGTILNGQAPPSQNIIISNTKTGILNWASTPSEIWVQVSQESGTGYCVMNISVNPSGLSVGTYTGTITISDPNASNSPQTVYVTLNVYNPNQTSAPFGTFATPIDGSTVRSSIPVTGWVLDDIGVESVKIYRGEINNLVYIGDAVFVEGARPDVEQAYPGYPNNYQAGWGYMMLTNFLPDNGNGTFKIHAIAEDIEGNQVTLGIKAITCDNANAVKPFGAIDTPAQGGLAAGSNYRNQGWVLTPMPNSMPTDGSTINVIVDGINIGHPTYNVYRQDIAALFPGYANSNGALAYFDLDTTIYSNGVHTISWNVTDDVGNTDGIGSRYFSIRNTNSPASGGARESNVTWFKDLKEFPLDYSLPIGVKKGFRKNAEKVELFSNENGNTNITIKELGRVEIHIANLLSGYMKVGHQLNSLPIGSTLDTQRDIFYWQPGPGFMGKYHLVFILEDQDGNMIRKNVIVNIVFKFSKQE